MTEPVNKYNRDQLTTIDTVGQAHLEGLDLEKGEKLALWKLACGGVPVDAYLGEDDCAECERLKRTCLDCEGRNDS